MRLVELCSMLLLVSCAQSARSSLPSPEAGKAPLPAEKTPTQTVVAQASSSPSAPVAEASSASGCGRPSETVECRSFSSPERAFAFVLQKRPKLLAIGEAHAQKGTENVTSATRRFAEQLLPMLKGTTSDLVIELWVRSGSCGQVEQKVVKKQQPVTQSQAASNQNEYVWLGHRAKALGISPHALSPSCDDYRRIANAGPEDIDRMLEMIRDASQKQLTALLEIGKPALIVAYGGALHNDLFPREGRERWSFGPELAQITSGRYVELDLIVPEYVKDEPAWRSFPWYAAYDGSLQGRETWLFSRKDSSFTLVFPRTAQPDAAPDHVPSMSSGTP